jgi:two-component system response regulator HydG
VEARILVVEDDLAMRELLVKVLENQRFVTRGASNGWEALALLTDGAFDLILSDIRMSPMDGLSLASQAKSLAPKTKVLLMSAYGGRGGARRARAAGADAYMSKPFSMSQLVAAVRALIRQAGRQQRKGKVADKRSRVPSGGKEQGPCFD